MAIAMDEPGVYGTITPLFIGLLISMALWGISCLQAFHYFRDYPKDSWVLKVLVTLCWVADTANQILVSYTLYTLVVVDFSNSKAITFIPKSLPLSIPFLEVSSLAVQSYFTYRIWKLSERSWILTGLAVLLIVAKLGCTINYTVRALMTPTFLQLDVKMDRLTTGHIAIDVASDGFISVVMCWLLHNNKSAFTSTQNIINKTIIFTVTTGGLTGVLTVVMLIVHLLRPESLLYFGLYFVLGRLYSNSMLAALNIRRSLRWELGDIELGETKFWPGSPNRSLGHRRHESLTIKVDTVLEKTVDPFPDVDLPRRRDGLERFTLPKM